MITPNTIEIVEIDLINRCNLSCPLCSYTNEKVSEEKKQFIQFDYLLEFLDQLPNLKQFVFIGNYSDFTFYPKILEFIKYLKDRDINLIIGTNATAKSENFWKSVGLLLTKSDYIHFAIDGATQDVYEKYRIGGSLEKVISNHKTLKAVSQAITVLQFIIFEHNKNDIEKIKQLFIDEKFDFLHIKNNCIISERFSTNGKLIMHQKMSRDIALSKPKIRCDAYARNEIYIKYNGKITRCAETGGTHQGHMITDHIDDIIKGLNDFQYNNTCYNSCNKIAQKILEITPEKIYDNNMNEYIKTSENMQKLHDLI